MGKSSQRKGADGERELADVLRGYGYDISRGGSLSFGDRPDLEGLQAIRDSERFRDGAPAVFHRRNRQPWLVTMLLSDWVRLYGGGGK